MDSKTNKILAKLSKEKGLKKVQLSKLEDIEESIGRCYYILEDFFEEQYDIALEAAGKCFDVLRFDYSDSYAEAEGGLDDLLQEIKELGVDIPPRVKELQKELQDLDGLENRAEQKLRNIGRA